jgi:hypothetical protein
MEINDLELEKILDKQIDIESRKLFDYINKNGSKAFTEGNPLYQYRETDLINRLINYFEANEEYEKCSVLVNVKKSL